MDSASWSVATALAVLAGIAASDAACCASLGRRPRGENHHDAEQLLREIKPGGPGVANSLKRLVDLKDKAQYGMVFVSRADLRMSIKQADKILDFADQMLVR